VCSSDLMPHLLLALVLAAAAPAGQAQVAAASAAAPAPGIDQPDRLTLTDLYWGRVVQEWSIPRGGEGRWSQADGKSQAFPVTEAELDRPRGLLRPGRARALELR